MSIKEVVMSDDVFEQICEMINIAESERDGVIKLTVEIEVGEPVVYTAKKYAVKNED